MTNSSEHEALPNPPAATGTDPTPAPTPFFPNVSHIRPVPKPALGNPTDAAILSSLEAVATNFFSTLVARDVEDAKAAQKAAEIKAEAELKKAQVDAEAAFKLAELEATAEANRETTIRWSLPVFLVCLTAMVCFAIKYGKMGDPIASLPTLALVIGFLKTLMARPEKSPPAKQKETP